MLLECRIADAPARRSRWRINRMYACVVALLLHTSVGMYLDDRAQAKQY